MIGSKYFGEYADITLLKYSIFIFENEKHVFCSEVEIPEIYEIPEKPRNIDGEMNYIKDENVKDAFARTIEAIKQIGNNRNAIIITWKIYLLGRALV